jgi:hypothetical protein
VLELELNVDMDVVGGVSKESWRVGVVLVVATVQERLQELRWIRPTGA